MKGVPWKGGSMKGRVPWKGCYEWTPSLVNMWAVHILLECIFVVAAPAKQLNFTPVLDWFEEFSTKENEINRLIIKAPKADYANDVSAIKPLNYRFYRFDWTEIYLFTIHLNILFLSIYWLWLQCHYWFETFYFDSWISKMNIDHINNK